MTGHTGVIPLTQQQIKRIRERADALSNFAHRRQQHESDCLVACAEMVLNHLGLQIGYKRLAKLLRVGPSFTPFTHLRYLESLRLSITLDKQGNVSIFEANLVLGLPVIGVELLEDHALADHVPSVKHLTQIGHRPLWGFPAPRVVDYSSRAKLP